MASLPSPFMVLSEARSTGLDSRHLTKHPISHALLVLRFLMQDLPPTDISQKLKRLHPAEGPHTQHHPYNIKRLPHTVGYMIGAIPTPQWYKPPSISTFWKYVRADESADESEAAMPTFGVGHSKPAILVKVYLLFDFKVHDDA